MYCRSQFLFARFLRSLLSRSVHHQHSLASFARAAHRIGTRRQRLQKAVRVHFRPHVCGGSNCAGNADFFAIHFGHEQFDDFSSPICALHVCVCHFDRFLRAHHVFAVVLVRLGNRSGHESSIFRQQEEKLKKLHGKFILFSEFEQLVFGARFHFPHFALGIPKSVVWNNHLFQRLNHSSIVFERHFERS